MESVEVLEIFSRYGIDFALMAAAAALLTFAIDRFIFSKLNLSEKGERAVKLLPYVLGVIFYAVYYLLCDSGIGCFFENLAEILQQGLAVGTLGFVLRLCISKIESGKKVKTTDVEAVALLIEGYICEGEEQSTAQLLCEAIEGGNSQDVESILNEHAAEGVTEAELKIVQQLVLNYFSVTEND